MCYGICTEECTSGSETPAKQKTWVQKALLLCSRRTVGGCVCSARDGAAHPDDDEEEDHHEGKEDPDPQPPFLVITVALSRAWPVPTMI